jgi:hypothetical protein
MSSSHRLRQGKLPAGMACDRCYKHHVRCNGVRPCYNCHRRGVPCVDLGAVSPSPSSLHYTPADEFVVAQALLALGVTG